MKKITLKDLHEINNKYPDKQFIHQTYYYDQKKREWIFKGYSCSVCGKIFKRVCYIDEHEQACKPSLTLANKKLPEAKIISDSRKEWHPLDINQNLTFGKN